jgi:mono/diheme cytochrome c family protein
MLRCTFLLKNRLPIQKRLGTGILLAGLLLFVSVLCNVTTWDPATAARASDQRMPVLVKSPTLQEDKFDEKDADAADVKFFREEIEPVFKETCQRCHGEKKQESNLRLDSREALLKGGKNGPTIVPGKPDESLLLKVLEYNGDIQMPPDEKLDDETRAAFKKWIEKQAPWPKAKAK